MNLYLQKITPDMWKLMSSTTHKVSFGEDRDPEMDRIDYALVVNNDKEPCGYCTIIEIDKNSAYMQHGGAFPSVEKNVYTVKCYFMFINWLKEHYSCISTRILNQNIPMIKLAMAAGLRISGTELNDGDLFLSLLWKKKA